VLKIIIVDDEEKIRLGLAKLIEKASSTYEIVGLFADAYEVLQAIPNLQVDIMITDIVMSGMNGLQLIEQIKKQMPDLECVILSGFGEFNYARTALQFGVAGYLLKPVDKIELYQTLKMLEYKVHTNSEERILIRKNALKEILFAKVHRDLIEAHITKYKLNAIDFASYGVMVVKPKEYSKAIDLISRFEGFGRFEILDLEGETFAVIIYTYDLAGVVDALENMLTHNGEAIFSIGISSLHQGLIELEASFHEAMDSIEYNMYTVHKVTSFQEVQFGHLQEIFYYRTKIKQSLEIFDVSDLSKIIIDLFREIAYFKPRKNVFVQLLDPIFSNVTFITMEIERCMKLAEIQASIERLLIEKLQYLQTENESKGSQTIHNVKKIIDLEYDQELSLQKIADKVFLTTSYLSKLFKQETGETITEYITTVRLNKAKQLLKSKMDLKTYEVGELVGYGDPAYFNKLFKKVVGVTPKEYRDHVL
jgi:two-component system response regulator YesN